MNVYTATFSTKDGHIANGCFCIDDRNKVEIRIETSDKTVHNSLLKETILNCVSNNKQYFFSELMIKNGGYTANNCGDATYFVEIDAYLFGEGINCNDLDELQIKEVSTAFNYLNCWYKGISPVAISYSEHLQSLQENYTGKAVSTKFEINKDLTIKLQVYGTDLIGFEEKFQVVFNCQSQKLKDYNSAIDKFSRFLSLLCHLKVEVNEPITCFLEESYFILHRYIWVLDEKTYPHLLTTYDEIKDSFSDIIKNYYNTPKLFPVIQTVNSSLYIPNSMVGGISERFLLLSKTVESMYSLNLLYDFTNDEKKYKQQIDEILTRVENKKDRDFLSQKLANSQRATFKMKFIQFLKMFKPMFLENDKDIDLFAKIIKDTRNYYTHVTQVPGKIIAENKLSLINRMLESMISYHLLWWYNDKKVINGRFTLLNQSLVAVKGLINGDLNNLCKD